ncbi:MAG: isochorismate synthase [Candidatus Zixiibacteriota bacterium]|nr:MAG: isochorismate synthase [candidate division Zixibacteria bacterium]
MTVSQDNLQASDLRQAASMLAEKMETLLASPPESGRPAVAARRLEVHLPDISPLDWLRRRTDTPQVYWAGREGEFETAGVGTAETVAASARQTPADTLAAVRTRLAGSDGGIRYYGGLRFDPESAADRDWQPFGKVLFVLPRFELVRTPHATVFAVNLLTDEDEQNRKQILSELSSLCRDAGASPIDIPKVVSGTNLPDREDWSRAVNSAHQAFAAGQLEKIVLARKTGLTMSAEPEALSLLTALKQKAVNAFHFCFRPDPHLAFIGTSPERLYCRDGGRLAVDAIAGTRPRGTTPQEDEHLGQQLLDSQKDRLEQQLVVRSIAESLKVIGTGAIEDGTEVQLLKLARVQHLVSYFDTGLKPGIADDAILPALHPTAAVGGYPRQAAVEVISRLEPFDRGWYAGPVGWIARDKAEFAVAIRSALVSGEKLNIFAGAGILPDSKAADEWDELESKITAFTELVNR